MVRARRQEVTEELRYGPAAFLLSLASSWSGLPVVSLWLVRLRQVVKKSAQLFGGEVENLDPCCRAFLGS